MTIHAMPIVPPSRVPMTSTPSPIAARRPQSITQSPDRLGLNSDYLGMSGDKHDDSVQC
jgi:hypothetical protein